ncbi:hypothetical protein RRG08_018493 [Elysia crispata]|uniref:Uncharacterized protein n=1 Tax=Elysia crispata TaxID=231223 RepID=A0AAE0YZH3_9GAST|nr:hypothetical protein RRG08_018493 [Elysia crispata]
MCRNLPKIFPERLHKGHQDIRNVTECALLNDQRQGEHFSQVSVLTNPLVESDYHIVHGHGFRCNLTFAFDKNGEGQAREREVNLKSCKDTEHRAVIGENRVKVSWTVEAPEDVARLLVRIGTAQEATCETLELKEHPWGVQLVSRMTCLGSTLVVVWLGYWEG